MWQAFAVGVPVVVSGVLGLFSWAALKTNDDLREQIEVHKEATLVAYDMFEAETVAHQTTIDINDNMMRRKTAELEAVAEAKRAAETREKEFRAIRDALLEIPDEQDPIVSDGLSAALGSLNDHWVRYHDETGRARYREAGREGG